ncbi:Ig-like domain-containing protein [Polaribacter sp. PL03]|uniref:Ig-like domain-containing protein n=1 Tax=Polaribacter sp. PL03 TaxID=3088353 RepID=UPI0029CE9657|nr:Ig-like domain-containing protein [Polaribacter sp. PL03]MDX6747476.1 Ig-like domain-containing protein [Polaribacter sp. PL03]
MKFIYKTLFLLLSIALISSCAKTGRPDGGPKDELAPLFVSSEPPYETINFKNKEIRLSFNEFVKLKDLDKQLVVSPPLKSPLLITPQGTASRFLNIKILDTLKPNTTYIFNFGNAIEDNNESNKLEGFKYVFSTGTYIDSLVTSGSVTDAFLNKKPKKTNIVLYRIDSTFTDSIVYKKKPNYVATALDTTKFNFTNLREGKYLLLALEESSSDYIFDPKVDKIGFYTDIITLPKDSIITKPIKLFKETQTYRFKRAKETFKGKIEFGYEGKIKDFKVELLSKVPDNFKSVSRFEIDKDTLNYWHTPIDVDSLNFIVYNDKFLDTVTVRLRKNKLDSLNIKPSTSGTLHLRDTFYIKSNNPIVKIDTSKIVFINKDTIRVKYANYISKKENKIGFIFDKKQKENYTLKALPGSFTDVYDIKNDSLNYNFKTVELEDYGRITLNVVNTTSKNVIIDLLSGKDNDQIIERRYVSTSETLVFNLLEPKTYTIRAIVDDNNNRIWDTGNYLLKQQPENIIYYKEELQVRANYFLEGNTFTIKNSN